MTVQFRQRWWPSTCHAHGSGRVAEDRHEIGPLTELIGAVGHVRQQLVETHDVARLRESPVRQRRPQQVQAELALVRRQILQHHSVAEHVRVDVQPGAPLLGIEGKHRPPAPIRVERPEKGLCGLRNGYRAHARDLEREEALADRTVRRDTRQRLGHAGGSLVDQACKGGGNSFLRRAENGGMWFSPKSVQ